MLKGPSLGGGTGVSRLTRGLVNFPKGGSRSLKWSELGMEDPQEDPLAVHCFCVCSGSVLLGDLLGVSRSMERDLQSVMSIYPRIFLRVFIVCRFLVGFLFVLLYSAMYSCVLEGSFYSQSLDYRGDKIISTKPRWKGVFMCIFLLFGLFMLLCVPPPTLHYIYFIHLWHDIAYLC